MNVSHCTAESRHHQRKERQNVRLGARASAGNNLEQLPRLDANLTIVVNEHRSDAIQQNPGVRCDVGSRGRNKTAEFGDGLETETCCPVTATLDQFLQFGTDEWNELQKLKQLHKILILVPNVAAQRTLFSNIRVYTTILDRLSEWYLRQTG